MPTGIPEMTYTSSSCFVIIISITTKILKQKFYSVILSTLFVFQNILCFLFDYAEFVHFVPGLPPPHAKSQH